MSKRALSLGSVHLLTLKQSTLNVCALIFKQHTQIKGIALPQFKPRAQNQVIVLELHQELLSHPSGYWSKHLTCITCDNWSVLLTYLFSDERRERHCSLSRSFAKPCWIDLNQTQHYAISQFLYAKLQKLNRLLFICLNEGQVKYN